MYCNMNDYISRVTGNYSTPNILHLASAGDHSSSTGNIKLSTTIVLYMLV